MNAALSYLVGFMIACAVFLMLSRNIVRFLFGLVIVSNAINLLLFTCGRLVRAAPPLISSSPAEPMANALPQALILTAIVIGFAMVAFILVLYYRTYQTFGTVDSEQLRSAEPRDPTAASSSSVRGAK